MIPSIPTIRISLERLRSRSHFGPIDRPNSMTGFSTIGAKNDDRNFHSPSIPLTGSRESGCEAIAS